MRKYSTRRRHAIKPLANPPYGLPDYDALRPSARMPVTRSQLKLYITLAR
jgi:hypothetical protein